MTADFIQGLQIESYGCVQKANLKLSPLHALIGPNDSGKSTVLRALRTVTQLGGGRFTYSDGAGWGPFDPMLEGGDPDTSIRIGFADSLQYRVDHGPKGTIELVSDGSVDVKADAGTRAWNKKGLIAQSNDARVQKIREHIRPPTMVRFDPNALRAADEQILSHMPIQLKDETGRGLASVYQAINSRLVDTFVEIRNEVRRHFPTIDNILVPTVDGSVAGRGRGNNVVLQVKLKSGKIIPAAAVSEGLLYYLGFAALQHLDATKLILVEEPENGLHPSRIAEVVRMLREISKTTQVVIATHSPLVINELEGHEVTVVTRDENTGTHATLIKDTPSFDERSKVYALGELWLSYANGVDEAPLLKGGERT